MAADQVALQASASESRRNIDAAQVPEAGGDTIDRAVLVVDAIDKCPARRDASHRLHPPAPPAHPHAPPPPRRPASAGARPSRPAARRCPRRRRHPHPPRGHDYGPYVLHARHASRLSAARRVVLRVVPHYRSALASPPSRAPSRAFYLPRSIPSVLGNPHRIRPAYGTQECAARVSAQCLGIVPWPTRPSAVHPAHIQRQRPYLNRGRQAVIVEPGSACRSPWTHTGLLCVIGIALTAPRPGLPLALMPGDQRTAMTQRQAVSPVRMPDSRRIHADVCGEEAPVLRDSLDTPPRRSIDFRRHLL